MKTFEKQEIAKLLNEEKYSEAISYIEGIILLEKKVGRTVSYRSAVIEPTTSSSCQTPLSVGGNIDNIKNGIDMEIVSHLSELDPNGSHEKLIGKILDLIKNFVE